MAILVQGPCVIQVRKHVRHRDTKQSFEKYDQFDNPLKWLWQFMIEWLWLKRNDEGK